MRTRVRAAVLAGLLASVLVTGCARTVGPPEASPEPPPASLSPAVYDPSLTPSAAVLSLVPTSATRLSVTDFSQITLDLGLGLLTSASPAADLARYARLAPTRSPEMTLGLLRPVDAQLRSTYGFTSADVLWEAHFAGPDGYGWVLKLRDDLPTDGVKAAVAAGVGPLSGATFYSSTHIVLKNATVDPTHSWAAEPSLVDLVGDDAAATYVQRDCVPFDTAFGAGVRDQLAPAVSADLAAVEPLTAFSVSIGSNLATVHLGEVRDDAFARARLADHLPATAPDFARGYTAPVADPVGGRIGYTLGDPHVAALLALDQHVPFAVCPTS